MPDAWLIAGPWGGRAGLSLWGLDYEKDLSPNVGDPYLLSVFDSTTSEKWGELDRQGEQFFRLPNLTKDYMWSRGTAYAFLYVNSDTDVDAILHLAETGFVSQAWLNGAGIEAKPDRPSPVAAAAVYGVREKGYLDKNDQGGVVSAIRAVAEVATRRVLPLRKGVNRLLLKLAFQQKSGESFSFATQFTGPDDKPLTGVSTTLVDPTPSLISRVDTSRLVPSVHTNAPFNLVRRGEPVTLAVSLGAVRYFPEEAKSPFAFSGTLELSVCDYDGREIMKRSIAAAFPSEVKFDLGQTWVRGYYATHLRLLDKAGHLVKTFPPDGFSVIGGTSAQDSRKEVKKMAVTYYFMAVKEEYKSVYFPYMKRIGIFRNIGGHNTRALPMYKQAAEEGLHLTADLWHHRDADYVDAYAKETAPYVDSFKSFNEVDIVHEVRGTPESWVKKAKQDFDAARRYAPKATVLGGSLVRPASDDWFEECLKLGLDKYHDVWDVHCYPQGPPVLGGSMANSPNETERGVLKVYKKLGMTNTKPFWIGETGARATHGADARRWQAEMIPKMVACALSRKDFERIGFLVPWWYSRERKAVAQAGDIEVGHMPGEAALYTASALIDGFRDYEQLDFGPAVQAARFGPTMMLWRKSGPSQASINEAGNDEYVQVDLVGRVTALPRAEDGSINVGLSESPIYVLTRANYEHLTRTK